MSKPKKKPVPVREISETEPWQDQQCELDFELNLAELSSALRCAEGAENKDDFTVSIDDAIEQCEALVSHLRELKEGSA